MSAVPDGPPRAKQTRARLALWAGCAVLFAAGRFALRPRRCTEVPQTSVRVGDAGWEESLRGHLAEQGYAHLQGLLLRGEAGRFRALAEGFCYGDFRKALPLSFGGYSVPGFLDVPEFAEARWLLEDERLHRVLRAAFNGTFYRFAAHHDVGCDFVGVWHKDILRGDVAKFQKCDVWSRDEHGEGHEIYKVIFYLQDHDQDDLAMKVIPGSHKLARTPWEKGFAALHPVLGDAMIFDQRLSHCGNHHYGLFGPGRLFLQVGFGRANRFTDEFERGTRDRQERLRRKMEGRAPTRKGWATALQDLRFAAIGLFMSAMPPQLLNFFADRDVGRERNCEGGGAALGEL